MDQAGPQILPAESSGSKYQVGIIGNNYGYRELLPVLESFENVKTTFIVQSKSKTSKNISVNKNMVTKDLSTALIDEKLQLIFLAVPPSEQFSVSRLILESKKDLYCEKPVGVNFAQTDSLDKISKKNKNKVFVGFQFRFDPGIYMLKELIKLNLLGNISNILVNWHTSGESAMGDKGNWRNNIFLGGGVHRDFLCHVVDYVKWICGDSILSSLRNLSINSKSESNLRNLYLYSDDISSPSMQINLSRGNVSKSYWEVSISSEIGEFNLSSSYPFTLGSYRITYTGTKDYCKNIKEFTNSNDYLMERFENKSARRFALEGYFKKLILNVFEDRSSVLPGLEDAKFTQRISDNIQNQIRY